MRSIVTWHIIHEEGHYKTQQTEEVEPERNVNCTNYSVGNTDHPEFPIFHSLFVLHCSSPCCELKIRCCSLPCCSRWHCDVGKSLQIANSRVRHVARSNAHYIGLIQNFEDSAKLDQKTNLDASHS